MTTKTGANPRVHALLAAMVMVAWGAAARPILAQTAADALPSAQKGLDVLRTATGGLIVSHYSPETRVYDMVRATGTGVLALDNVAATPESRALSFLNTYGAVVGVRPVTPPIGTPFTHPDLAIASVQRDTIGATHVRVNQVYNGLAVFGAQLIVHMNGTGITAVNGTYVPGIAVSTVPAIDSGQAASRALFSLAKERDATLRALDARLMIYRTALLEGFAGENRLAYSVEISGKQAREQVFVDAQTGAILKRISRRPEALNRIIYSPEYDPNNPNANVQRREGDPPSVLPPVNNLYDFAGETYDFFVRGFGRDAYDAHGATMRSVYLVNDACPNAYWNGNSTNYCPGFDVDDVVSHEWGHAYTEYTHNLIYSYQSGALNESYSDIWGETVDLHNGRDGTGGSNNAQPAPDGQRWLIGEDLPAISQPAVGLFRDMWSPTRYGNPDKVSSTRYACSTDDGGGVHSNSGVPNHAYAMLVDGKTFNGQTVAGIGFVKAGHIYYRAMTVYQFPSANFADHAEALEASCQDLLTSGAVLNDMFTGAPSGQVITASDCEQVHKAMLAVEMRNAPAQCNFQPLLDPNTPAKCDGATPIFTETWEWGGLGAWTPASAGVFPEWPNYNWTVQGSLPQGRSGSAAFAVDSKAGTCAPGGDYSGQFMIDSPAITIPAGTSSAHLRFDHFVETELEYDGGNVLYSVNGGPFQLVPPSAYLFNAPNTELAQPPPIGNNTNPKAGELAWHGANGGETTGSWGTTIISLTQIAAPGDSVRLRFDFGIDGCNGVTGWYVDTVEAYTCAGSGTVLPPTAPSQDPIQDDASPDQIGGVDTDGNYRINWTYPSTPVTQACRFRVEEATVSSTLFTDDAETLLVGGSNATWTGTPQWMSATHPDTGTQSYSVVYIDNLNATLAMASPLALPAGTAVELSFDSFEDIEEGFDFGFVEVSANGGAFVPVAQYSGTFSGRRTVDLSAFAGQSVFVRFRFTSDLSFSFPFYAGWFIDNIRVDAANFAPIGTVGGTERVLGVTGRAGGTYYYRVAGLFGDCGTSPTIGPYSNVRSISVSHAATLAPTADFTATPNPGQVGEAIAFDGSASHDNDNVGSGTPIVRYFWTFGDGQSQTTTSPMTTHTYSAPEIYRVTLTVTDDDGETDTTEQFITIDQDEPDDAEKVYGSGYIGDHDAHRKIGVEAKRDKKGKLKGHLRYDDKGVGLTVDGKEITTLDVNGPNARITGPCSINKVNGYTFTLDVIDGPDKNSPDYVRLTLSNGVVVEGYLSKGNIKFKR